MEIIVAIATPVLFVDTDVKIAAAARSYAVETHHILRTSHSAWFTSSQAHGRQVVDAPTSANRPPGCPSAPAPAATATTVPSASAIAIATAIAIAGIATAVAVVAVDVVVTCTSGVGGAGWSSDLSPQGAEELGICLQRKLEIRFKADSKQRVPLNTRACARVLARRILLYRTCDTPPEECSRLLYCLYCLYCTAVFTGFTYRYDAHCLRCRVQLLLMLCCCTAAAVPVIYTAAALLLLYLHMHCCSYVRIVPYTLPSAVWGGGT